MAKKVKKSSDPMQDKLASMQRERQALDREMQDVSPSYALVNFDTSASYDTLASDSDNAFLGTDPYWQDRLHYYIDWLGKHADYDHQRDLAREGGDYAREATRIEMVGKVKVATFAPFHARLSALQTFTLPQFLFFFLLCLLWVAGLYGFQLRMLSSVIAAITGIYAIVLLIDIFLVISLFIFSPEEQIDDKIVHALQDAEWPMYTILCPVYHEAAVIPQFVNAIQSLDYPTNKLQLLFLTEENDSETRTVIRALDLPTHFKIIVVPDGQPRTKPRACNYGLLYAEGSYVVIYDAEDIPDPLQLKKAVLTFANHGTNVACVQAKLNFYNASQNLLTRWFTAEYSLWFDIVLPSLQRARFPLPLGGTSNHFRIDMLRALGAWDAYNVTEDCDLGLRLKRYKMETVILNSTTLEEASPNLMNWMRQRSRWIKGYMQTYLVHMRNPLEQLRRGNLYEMFSFQVVVGSCLGVMLFNPIVWAMLVIFLMNSSETINVYHILFLGPVLYVGMFCLIFGNFFYLYLYLLACTRRKFYHLLPSTLFISLYWLLMSSAAFYALFELLIKPHYWQKTIHGFHLKRQQTGSSAPSQTALAAFMREETMPMPVVSSKTMTIGAVSSVTGSLKAIPAQVISPVSPRQKNARARVKCAKIKDSWQVATIIIACISSIVACWYFFEHHELLLYEDALSHMRIARSVFDNVTPGLAQLGSVWLPLPHILMWPFIWNNYVWQTGLAGSFAAMPCYVITAMFIFRAARKLTRNSAAAFVGSLAFILNPNVLYLQSTPLSETVCMATLAMACYSFLCWIEDGTTRSLVITAACTFLATLARYDGWSLFAAIWVFLPIIGLMKRYRFSRIISNSILFSLPGGMGIVLWLVWNKIIFGDPLYFQNSAYSSQAQQLQQLQANRLFAYHNLWEAIRYYTLDTVQSSGLLLCVLAVFGFLWFLFSRRLKVETVGLLVFLVPFAFYVLAQYTGQAVIWLPAAVPAGSHVTFYNARYGSQMVAPLAVLFAIFVANLRLPSHKRFNSLLSILFIGIVILQSFMIVSQGIISLQDGQDNYSCFEQFTVANYLAQHYQGGRILEDLFANQVDPTFIKVDFKTMVYEGSGQLWIQALEYPDNTVTWIIVKPTSSTDLVTHYIDLRSPAFVAEFTVVARQSDGLVLYHRVGTPLTPMHAGVPTWTVPHDTCSS